MIVAILAISPLLLQRYHRALWGEPYLAVKCGHPWVPQSLSPYSHLHPQHHIRTQQISLRTQDSAGGILVSWISPSVKLSRKCVESPWRDALY